MTRLGILLVVLGIGSFVLPMIGFQFRLMDLVADYQPFAGIIVAVIGAVLLYLGLTQRAKEVASPTPAPAPAPSASEPPSA
jgi:threonine/homoserine/homoserine lactone efflux protein